MMKTMRGAGSADDIAGRLQKEILDSGLSCSLVDGVSKNVGGCRVHMMVFDKYYMRASNRASLTVLVTGDDRSVEVEAIGAGGGQGALFSFSWGTEESFEGVVEQFLKENGFR